MKVHHVCFSFDRPDLNRVKEVEDSKANNRYIYNINIYSSRSRVSTYSFSFVHLLPDHLSRNYIFLTINISRTVCKEGASTGQFISSESGSTVYADNYFSGSKVPFLILFPSKVRINIFSLH